MRRDTSTISTALETTLVRRRKRARKWRILLLSCSIEKVRSLPVKSWSSGDKPMEPFPVVGEEGFAFDADFIEELLTGGVITATKHPGDGAASDRVIRAPNPELASLFLRK